MSTYQHAHPLYRRLGWPSALPLAPRTKGPPPAGFTGWDGIDPSFPDCLEFEQLAAYRGTGQVALRMPSTVIGVDVDAYGGRTGAATVAEATRRWGPLPSGPWSSARDDGVSGIRFYRVPDGTVLVANLAFPELRVGHVEIIQRHHRYAVVWPSVHPTTGTGYTWRGTAAPDMPPAVGDLPELPAAWVAALAGTGCRAERARPEQVERFVAALPAGVACDAVRAAVRAASCSLAAPIVSRHDDVRDHVLRLLRLGERGHPGVSNALAALRVVFVRAVTADGSRTVASAEGEFDRMRDGAHGIGLIETTPTPADRGGCRCGVAGPSPTRAVVTGLLRKVLAADDAERPALLRWAVRRLHAYGSAGQLPDEQVAQLVAQLTDAAGGGTR